MDFKVDYKLEGRDKWRKYVHGVANRGRLKNRKSTVKVNILKIKVQRRLLTLYTCDDDTQGGGLAQLVVVYPDTVKNNELLLYVPRHSHT